MRSVIQFASGQLISLDLVGDGVTGKDGNAGIDFQSSFDGFNIIEFHDDGNFHTRTAQDFIGCFASRNVFLKGNKILPAQILYSEAFLFAR